MAGSGFGVEGVEFSERGATGEGLADLTWAARRGGGGRKLAFACSARCAFGRVRV